VLARIAQAGLDPAGKSAFISAITEDLARLGELCAYLQGGGRGQCLNVLGDGFKAIIGQIGLVDVRLEILYINAQHWGVLPRALGGRPWTSNSGGRLPLQQTVRATDQLRAGSCEVDRLDRAGRRDNGGLDDGAAVGIDRDRLGDRKRPSARQGQHFQLAFGRDLGELLRGRFSHHTATPGAVVECDEAVLHGRKQRRNFCLRHALGPCSSQHVQFSFFGDGRRAC
jgi:hypothetical protein